MGFQGWLGKTVVDSNLLPYKITIHMIMALLIVLLLIILLAREKSKPVLKGLSSISQTKWIVSHWFSVNSFSNWNGNSNKTVRRCANAHL